MNPYEHGGLNFIDFSTLKYTFKINWIRQFLRNPTWTWNFIPNFIFSKLGSLNFVLLCTYNVEKIPSKLSSFHKQVLLSWALIYTPRTNAKFPFYQRNTLWFFDAISTGVIMLLRNLVLPGISSVPLDPRIIEVGQTSFSQSHYNNHALFQKEHVSVPHVLSYWNNTYSNLVWEKIWHLPSKYFLTNKIKEISFKIIHCIYPCKTFLRKFKKDSDTSCSFCDQVPEDIQHLFWDCPYSSLFRRKTSDSFVISLSMIFPSAMKM